MLYVSMSTYCMSSVHQFFYSRCEAEYNSNEAWFFCLVVWFGFWCFETRFLCETLAVLELTVKNRLT